MAQRLSWGVRRGAVTGVSGRMKKRRMPQMQQRAPMTRNSYFQDGRVPLMCFSWALVS